jgi:hypothetical protein
MEVVIPILAAAGLMFAGKNDKKQNNDMLNRETMKQAKESEKEAKKEDKSPIKVISNNILNQERLEK